MPADKTVEVDFVEGGAFEGVVGEFLVVEAGVSITNIRTLSSGSGCMENSQIRNIHRHIGFAGEVVGQQSDVGVFPAEEVGDQHHRCVFARACDVRLVTGRRERDDFAFGGALPFEASAATFGERHGEDGFEGRGCLKMMLLLLVDSPVTDGSWENICQRQRARLSRRILIQLQLQSCSTARLESPSLVMYANASIGGGLSSGVGSSRSQSSHPPHSRYLRPTLGKRSRRPPRECWELRGHSARASFVAVFRLHLWGHWAGCIVVEMQREARTLGSATI